MGGAGRTALDAEPEESVLLLCPRSAFAVAARRVCHCRDGVDGEGEGGCEGRAQEQKEGETGGKTANATSPGSEYLQEKGDAAGLASIIRLIFVIPRQQRFSRPPALLLLLADRAPPFNACLIKKMMSIMR